MIDIEKRRENMLRRLKALDGKLHEIEEELESHHNPDWEESAQEREGDEVLEGVGVASQKEIRMIQAALERMDAGEYGICVTCGNPISEDRLDVLPCTPFCRNCAM
ncbi:TraR/DksA family transcriptional regulator [Rhodobacteraceae bacterium W635]|uniref:TraR/DksA family transcriptional regulator n=1 Tax=Nioella halotolerans TaxID=2303578 RepID=UPI000E3B7D04|nr:TraR/DksA family transcriptional regulator [Rhodobacteraceae bacterium W635]